MGTFQNAFYPKQEHSPWADVHPHGVGRQPKKTGPPQPSSTMGASALTLSTGMRIRRRMATVKVLSLVHNGVLWGQGQPARTFKPLRRVRIQRNGPMRHVLLQLKLHLPLQDPLMPARGKQLGTSVKNPHAKNPDPLGFVAKNHLLIVQTIQVNVQSARTATELFTANVPQILTSRK